MLAYLHYLRRDTHPTRSNIDQAVLARHHSSRMMIKNLASK
jgi:hypothetical protein